MTTNEKDLEILDAIYQDAALAEAAEGTSTGEDRQWAGQVRARIQSRLAEMRRNLVPATAPVKPARPVRPSILAMGRDALLARLAELTDRIGGSRVQVAHRHLSGLSDDDLRRLLDTIEAEPE